MVAQEMASMRFRKALTVVAIVVAVPLACLSFASTSSVLAGEQSEMGGTYVGRMWPEIQGGTSIDEAKAAVGFCAVDASEAPEWFEREVMDPAQLSEGMVSEDWQLVGYESSCSSTDSCMNDLADRLALKGWLGYSSGTDGVATFMKEGGDKTWMMASCMKVGNSVNVVLRFA